MRILTLAFLAALTAGPALADFTSGTVKSWDVGKRSLTLTDNTVWTLPADIPIPGNMASGDSVTITYSSKGDDGMSAILSVAPKS